MKTIQMDLLNLNGYRIKKVHENSYDINILLQRDVLINKCYNCGNEEAYKYGKRTVQYIDLPIRAKRVCLTIELQRYKCISCCTFYQDDTPHMSKYCKMSYRLEQYVLHQSTIRSFTHIANEIGVSEGNIRKLFKDRCVLNPINNHIMVHLSIIGIDEIKIDGKMRCVITDIKNKVVFDVLENRRKGILKNYLLMLKKTHQISVITIDMWKPYRDVIYEVMPNAKIVIDKFHVVRMANNAMETIRKGIRANLSSRQRLELKNDRFLLYKREHTLTEHEMFILSYWFNKYENLKRAYQAKEHIRKVKEAAEFEALIKKSNSKKQ